MSERDRHFELPLPITPESLIADNRSRDATYNLEQIKAAKTSGQQTVIVACGDPRAEPATLFDLTSATIISLRGIAAVIPDEEFAFVLGHRGVKQIIVLQHHDGTKVMPGHKLSGCGGLAAMEDLISGGESITGAISNHIKKIRSPDPFMQAYVMARRIGAKVNIPVLAATLDHTSGSIYALALIDNNGRSVLSSVAVHNIGDPEVAYAQGVPQLRSSELTDGFGQLMRDNQRQVAKLKKDQDLLNGLVNNDPRAVILTTSIISAALRYPKTFGKPNSCFMLGIPWVKKLIPEDDGIEKDGILGVFDQLHYPIFNAIKARPGTSFNRTDTIIIETPSMGLSSEIAGYLLQLAWINEWLLQRNAGKHRSILTAQVKSGVTQKIQELKVTV